ncbi:hypothetical protein Tco_1190347 [Tanacetum coccineum]
MFKLVEMVFNLPWNLPFLGAKRLTSPEQTAIGKDKSNPLIVGSLLKTIRFSIHLVACNEELAILEQMATSKGKSNPLIADDLLKIIWLLMYHGVNTPGSDENSMKLHELRMIAEKSKHKFIKDKDLTRVFEYILQDVQEKTNEET